MMSWFMRARGWFARAARLRKTKVEGCADEGSSVRNGGRHGRALASRATAGQDSRVSSAGRAKVRCAPSESMSFRRAMRRTSPRRGSVGAALKEQ